MPITEGSMYGRKLWEAVEAYASNRTDRSLYDAIVKATTAQANDQLAAQDPSLLYPEFSRVQLEEELLKEQAALFLAAQQTLNANAREDYPKIVQLISSWERRAKPIADDSRRKKLERNAAPASGLLN